MKIYNLENQKFVRLKVLKRVYKPNKNKQKIWLCKCDCGNYVETTTRMLTSHSVRSCGCIRRKPNIIQTNEEYAFIIINDKKVIFDKSDISKIGQKTWNLTKNGYVISSDNIYMHRFLLDSPTDKIIDHINHNKLDNRKENLRICGYSINGINKKIRSNTGYYGISLTPKGYTITVDGKYVGHKMDLQKAIELRNECLKNSKALMYNEYLKEEFENAIRI